MVYFYDNHSLNQYCKLACYWKKNSQWNSLVRSDRRNMWSWRTWRSVSSQSALELLVCVCNVWLISRPCFSCLHFSWKWNIRTWKRIFGEGFTKIFSQFHTLLHYFKICKNIWEKHQYERPLDGILDGNDSLLFVRFHLLWNWRLAFAEIKFVGGKRVSWENSGWGEITTHTEGKLIYTGLKW